MNNHIQHLIIAYVHGQLPRQKRDRVRMHVSVCRECKAALIREQQLARDLTRQMPQIGQPARGQLARLWPSVWMEFRTPRKRGVKWLPSYSLAIMMIVFCAFAVSALIVGPTQVIAAPFQAAPTEILATATLVKTDEPVIQATAEASEPADPFTVPMASPAPIAGINVMSQVRFVSGK
jgi:anti-sigma factor RsiW